MVAVALRLQINGACMEHKRGYFKSSEQDFLRYLEAINNALTS